VSISDSFARAIRALENERRMLQSSETERSPFRRQPNADALGRDTGVPREEVGSAGIQYSSFACSVQHFPSGGVRAHSSHHLLARHDDARQRGHLHPGERLVQAAREISGGGFRFDVAAKARVEPRESASSEIAAQAARQTELDIATRREQL